MKAVRIHEHGGPDVLRWEEIADPECPLDRVILRIKASSINHLDIWVRNGFPGIPLPFIPGSDGSGVVHEVGAEVKDWEPGDEVMIQPGTYCSECRFCRRGKENHCITFGIMGESEDGTDCEYMVIEPKYLGRKPESLSFEEAAAFPLVFLTAYTMLVRRARIEEGEIVLVLGGASGVGSAAIQIAKLFGSTVIATGGNEDKLALSTELGADHVINHSKEVIHERVGEITDRWGVDIVFEHVGEATWNSSLRSLAKGGRLVTCGATTGPKGAVDMRHLFSKHQSVMGSTMGDAAAFTELLALLKEGRLKPVLDKTFPMSEIGEAHRYLESRQQLGKVVLVPR